MTREEAICELKYAQEMSRFDPTTGEVGFRNTEDERQYNAFDMAIEALQAQQWIPCSERLPERKTGEWIFEEYPDGHYHSECSVCGHQFIEDAYLKPYNYCPNCGAEMRGNKND